MNDSFDDTDTLADQHRFTIISDLKEKRLRLENLVDCMSDRLSSYILDGELEELGDSLQHSPETTQAEVVAAPGPKRKLSGNASKDRHSDTSRQSIVAALSIGRLIEANINGWWILTTVQRIRYDSGGSVVRHIKVLQ